MQKMKMFVAIAFAACAAIAGLGAVPAQAGDGYAHHLAIHVDENDGAKMNLALNNAANVMKYYEKQGEKVLIEIIAYGPGLNMLRSDKSPVKDRLDTYTMQYPDVKFAACGNTIAGMTKKEGAAPPLIKADNIYVVASGVVQIMKRQDQGWHYLRP